MVHIKEQLFWGPINEKGQQEETHGPLSSYYATKNWACAWSCLTHSVFLIHRWDPNPLLFDLPIVQAWGWLSGFTSGGQILWTQVPKRLSWKAPGAQHLEALRAWLKLQPLLLGKGQAPSPSGLTAWQIILSLWGHIRKSCTSLHSWQVCALSKVRYGTLFILTSRDFPA